jgi:hypothetical protein
MLRHQPHGQVKLELVDPLDPLGPLEHLVNIHLPHILLVLQAVGVAQEPQEPQEPQELMARLELLEHLVQQAREELVVTVEQSCLSQPRLSSDREPSLVKVRQEPREV